MAHNADTRKVAEAELTRKRRADVIQRLEDLNLAATRSFAPPNNDANTIVHTVKIVFDIRELLREYRRKSEQDKVADLSKGISVPLHQLQCALDSSQNSHMQTIKNLVETLGQELSAAVHNKDIPHCQMTKEVAEAALSAALTSTPDNPTERQNLKNMKQRITDGVFSSSEDAISKFIKNILQLVERVCRSSTYCDATHTITNFYHKSQTGETQPSDNTPTSDGSAEKVSM